MSATHDSAASVEPTRRRSPPRLVLRFTVITVAALAIAAVSMYVLARGFTVQQQQNAVKSHARFVTEVVLASELLPSDFAHVPSDRLVVLDGLFRRQVLVDSVVGAALYSSSGRVVYATDHRLIGTTTGDTANVLRAEHGTVIVSAVRRERVAGSSRQMLTEVVPIRFAGGAATGALVLWTDYSTIAAAARRALVPISIVLPLLLVALFVGLFPILRRATRQIRSHLDESEFDALHDGLTGLPNRRLFEDRAELALTQSRRDHRPITVMLLDLNRFKEVNDTLGHAAGDELLCEVASRLAMVLRGADTISRLGGDEFAVLLSGVEPADGRETAARIHEALAEPVLVQGLRVSVGASIGIALHPLHGGTVSTLLQHADVAMYESKRGHRPYVVYDPDADPNNAARLSLATELRLALQSDAIVLHYQPQMDLHTGEVTGVEALLRWQHPTLGLLEAERFMALAEQNGLTAAISERAVEAAIRQCGEWRRQGLNLAVAVNLDVRSLIDLEFRDRVAALLREHDVDAETIELEITETSLMSDPVRVKRVAAELAELGFHLAIDDFGTGYSSLSYLSQLPISKLKIDRSFVGAMTHSPRERIIVGATIELAHNLGLEVVAEGVENETTLELLRQLGSDLAQGYHIGPPAEAASFFGVSPDWIAA